MKTKISNQYFYDLLIEENIEGIKLELDKGDFNINDTMNDWLLLEHACFVDNPEMAKVFINHGADVNIKLNLDMSLLSYVCPRNQDEMVEVLLKAGANISDVDTELYKYCNGKTMKVLLDHGLDPNITLQEGQTLLSTALDIRNYELAVALVEGGADIEQDIRGKKLIARACEHGDAKLISALVKKGADLESVDEEIVKKCIPALMNDTMETVQPAKLVRELIKVKSRAVAEASVASEIEMGGAAAGAPTPQAADRVREALMQKKPTTFNQVGSVVETKSTKGRT